MNPYKIFTFSLIVMTIALSIWLGRPYHFHDLPECTNEYFMSQQKDGKESNCGNTPFIQRYHSHLMGLIANGTPAMMNLKITHEKECNDTALFLNGTDNLILYHDYIDGTDGAICLHIENNKDNL